MGRGMLTGDGLIDDLSWSDGVGTDMFVDGAGSAH